MDNREPDNLDTCIRDFTTSAGKITIQNTIPPTAPDIIVHSGPAGNMVSVQVKVTPFQRKSVPWRRTIYKCLKTKSLGKYLDLRGMQLMGIYGYYIEKM